MPIRGGRHDAVAAVVVNYEAGAALVDCVASLRDVGVDEVVVVDNGSSDGSLALLARRDDRIVVISPGANVGYGAGVNLGVQATSGELLLVCNPDIVVESNALDLLIHRLLADPTLGIVGPALVSLDGTVYPSGRAFPTLRRSSVQALVGVVAPRSAYSERYRSSSRVQKEPGIVDWVTGACLLVRRVAFDAIGGFDDSYFMYVEEVDLCWRLAAAGWRTGYEPSAIVMHLGGLSTSTHPYRMLGAHHRSLLRFFRRTVYGPERLLLPLVALGIGARLVVVTAREMVVRCALRLGVSSRRDSAEPPPEPPEEAGAPGTVHDRERSGHDRCR